MATQERELDKRIIVAAHSFLNEVQVATGELDKTRIVVGAIGAILNVAKAFGASPVEIMLDLRKRMQM